MIELGEFFLKILQFHQIFINEQELPESCLDEFLAIRWAQTSCRPSDHYQVLAICLSEVRDWCNFLAHELHHLTQWTEDKEL